MNVDEMEAGPELDALIAEKVMEWTGVHYRAGYSDEECTSPSGLYGKGPDGRVFLSKSYSTDIAAAWPVLEKINNAFGIMILVLPDGRTEVQRMRPRSLEGFTEKITVSADTAPLAICRAALKAILNDASAA